MVARFFVLVFAVAFGAGGICAAAVGSSKIQQSQYESSVPGAEAPIYKDSRVPYLFGRARADAEAQTRAAGFTPKFIGAAGSGATVVTQSVEAGRLLPPGVVITLRMGLAEGGAVMAPLLLGLNHDAAANRAEASGLKPIFYGPSGRGIVVASQSVSAGQQVARGTYVQLQMRAGAGVAPVRVPDFANLPIDAARALAQANHLRPVFGGDQTPDAHVVGQSPAAGTEVRPLAEVQLQVGAVQTRVPRFLGRSRAIAQAIAAKTGLTLDVTGDEGDLARVARQSPRPGNSLEPGGHVALVMAPPPPGDATGGRVPPVTGDGAGGDVQPPIGDKGPVETVVPDVSKDTRSLATSALEASGFKAKASGDEGADARVSDQRPAGGTMAPRGSTIAITMAKPSAKGGMGPWIAILAGWGVVAAVAAFVVTRLRRRDPNREIDADPLPDAHRHTDKPLPLVIYNASVDVGRPTARFGHEPKFAARALALPRETEGIES